MAKHLYHLTIQCSAHNGEGSGKGIPEELPFGKGISNPAIFVKRNNLFRKNLTSIVAEYHKVRDSIHESIGDDKILCKIISDGGVGGEWHVYHSILFVVMVLQKFLLTLDPPVEVSVDKVSILNYTKHTGLP